jgi:hypothetical protein
MAYDQTGSPLRAGARVMIPAIVTQILNNAAPHSNLAVELLHKATPDSPAKDLWLGSRQVVTDQPPGLSTADVIAVIQRRVNNLITDLAADPNATKENVLELVKADAEIWLQLAPDYAHPAAPIGDAEGTTTDATHAKEGTTAGTAGTAETAGAGPEAVLEPAAPVPEGAAAAPAETTQPGTPG